MIMSEQRKAVIKNADMSEDMQQDAVDIASQALAKYNIEKVREFFWLVLSGFVRTNDYLSMRINITIEWIKVLIGSMWFQLGKGEKGISL